MDIWVALAEGKRGAIARSSDVAAYIINHPAEMRTLIDAASCEDVVVVAHAVHALLTVFQHDPDLVKAFKTDLLALLLTCDQWEVIEQMCKVAPHLQCSSAEIDKLVRRLFMVVKQSRSSIARTCSLQALVDIVELYPDYQVQADEAMTFALEHGTKAMQARARNLL